jgi:hypothetical protein
MVLYVSWRFDALQRVHLQVTNGDFIKTGNNEFSFLFSRANSGNMVADVQGVGEIDPRQGA